MEISRKEAQRKRIIKIREHLDISQHNFAKIINAKKSTYYNYEKGVESADLSLEVITNIIEKFGIYSNWLLFGDGGDDIVINGQFDVEAKLSDTIAQNKVLTDKLKKAQEKNLEILITPNKGHNIAYWGNVDVTGGKVDLENNSDNRPTGFIQIPGFEDCQHAVNHYGDSMSPYINGGDVILLKHLENWMDYIPYGEVFLVITNNHRTVKYVRKSENPDNLLLVPHNSKYDAFEIPKKEILQMFLVKGSVQRKFL